MTEEENWGFPVRHADVSLEVDADGIRLEEGPACHECWGEIIGKYHEVTPDVLICDTCIDTADLTGDDD